MRRSEPKDPKEPQGESIVTQIIVSSISDFISGVISEIIIPKFKRLCGEKDDDGCKGEGECLPSCKESK